MIKKLGVMFAFVAAIGYAARSIEESAHSPVEYKPFVLKDINGDEQVERLNIRHRKSYGLGDYVVKLNGEHVATLTPYSGGQVEDVIVHDNNGDGLDDIVVRIRSVPDLVLLQRCEGDFRKKETYLTTTNQP